MHPTTLVEKGAVFTVASNHKWQCELWVNSCHISNMDVFPVWGLVNCVLFTALQLISIRIIMISCGYWRDGSSVGFFLGGEIFSSCLAFLEMESTVTTGTKYSAVWMLVERREECAGLSSRLCHRADIIMWYFCALESWACGLEHCQCSVSNHNLEFLCPPGPLSWMGGGSSFPRIASIWWYG